MIVGFILYAIASGTLLQPFSAQRLALLTSGVAGVCFLVTLLAVRNMERGEALAPELTVVAKPSFRTVIAEIWADRLARRFTVFVFVSMLAYSAQELILEPFAGLVFHMSPAQSAGLTGFEKSGALVGMILVGALGARFGDRRAMWMRRWTIAGCAGSAAALCGMMAACLVGEHGRSSPPCLPWALRTACSPLRPSAQ